MLFSEKVASFERLKGNLPAGCPDIQAPALSSTFNEVIFVFSNECYNFPRSRFLVGLLIHSVCKMSLVGDLKLFN